MDIVEAIIICTFVLTVGNIVLTIVRTIIDWKLYKGSDKYWKSWKTRSKDIIRRVKKQVIKELTKEELEKELRKRDKKRK